MTIKHFWHTINQWFFGKHSTWGLSIFRIAIGIVLLQKFLFVFPNLELWFTEYGVLDLATSQKLVGPERLNLFVTLDGLLFSGTLAHLMWSIGFAAILAFTLGLFTRASAFIAYVVITSMDHRNILILQGADTLMRTLMFWMIFARSNAYHSVDAWLAARKNRQIPEQASAWPLRALQFQVVVMYVSTFWHKTEGSAWWNGGAIYTVSQLIDFKHWPLPFVYDSWWSVKMASWSTLVFEGLFGFFIWFRETRRYVLLIGLLFHLALEWHLMIPLFQWATIASYAVFLESEDKLAIRQWWQSKNRLAL